MGLNPLPCFHSNYFLPVTFSIWVKINNTQRTLEFRNMQIGRLRYEFTSLDFKNCPVWGTSQRSRLLAEVFGLALGWLCWIVSPLLCDQYPSLCLNQRPAEVFAGCYLNDTKVRFENRAAVEARLTAGLAMNHTWVQINVALLANRDSTEILIGRSRFWGLCEWSAKIWPKHDPNCLLCRESLVKNSNTCIAYTGC